MIDDIAFFKGNIRQEAGLCLLNSNTLVDFHRKYTIIKKIHYQSGIMLTKKNKLWLTQKDVLNEIKGRAPKLLKSHKQNYPGPTKSK